jgi:hypothetical protein
MEAHVLRALRTVHEIKLGCIREDEVSTSSAIMTPSGRGLELP